jgi:hypothetical protein
VATTNDVIQLAQAELGKPYVYGDEGPNTFDCSGLMQWVYGQLGIRLPRTSQEQQRATTRVAKPSPGDLVFYGSPAYHVGLYIGGGKMIDAPKPGDRVKVQDVWGAPTYGRVAGLGGAAAPVLAAANSAAGGAAAAVSGLLGGARVVVLESVFLGAGVGLVGIGAVRLVGSQLKRGKK